MDIAYRAPRDSSSVSMPYVAGGQEFKLQGWTWEGDIMGMGQNDQRKLRVVS